MQYEVAAGGGIGGDVIDVDDGVGVSDDIVGAGVLLGAEDPAFDGHHADVLHVYRLGEASSASADGTGDIYQARAEEGQHEHGEDKVIFWLARDFSQGTHVRSPLRYNLI